MDIATLNQLANPSPNAEFIGAANRKGGITIPVEVRRLLQVKANDNVLFRVQGETVVIEPGSMTLEEAMGSVKPVQAGQTLEAVIQEAKAEHRICLDT